VPTKERLSNADRGAVIDRAGIWAVAAELPELSGRGLAARLVGARLIDRRCSPRGKPDSAEAVYPRRFARAALAACGDCGKRRHIAGEARESAARAYHRGVRANVPPIGDLLLLASADATLTVQLEPLELDTLRWTSTRLMRRSIEQTAAHCGSIYRRMRCRTRGDSERLKQCSAFCSIMRWPMVSHRNTERELMRLPSGSAR
jgi:hypothetical protein